MLMTKVHISQFYPCSSISIASELCYVCELGKYMFLNHNTQLSLDGVVLDSVLKKSKIWDYFRIMVRSGYICDIGISSIDIDITVQNSIDWSSLQLRNVRFVTDEVSYDYADMRKRSEDLEYDMCTPKPFQVIFTEQRDDIWLLEMNSKNASANTTNAHSLNGQSGKQLWVSLVAYVAVERLVTGKPNKLLLSFDSAVCVNYKALSYLLSLCDKTSCLYGWCFYMYDQTVTQMERLHQGYVSWYVEGEDLGMLGRFYSSKEKLEYLKKLDIKAGDVVMFYERSKTQKRDYLKAIASCHVAVIKAITSHGFDLLVINTTKLYYQGLYDFNDQTTIVKSMYTSSKPYEKLNATNRHIDFIDCGVEYEMRDELAFIVPLSSCSDSKISLVTDGEHVDKLVLPQNDFIYWLFKDYAVEFNEERFLERYFSARPTLYSMYMENGVVPEEFYFVEEQEE